MEIQVGQKLHRLHWAKDRYILVTNTSAISQNSFKAYDTVSREITDWAATLYPYAKYDWHLYEETDTEELSEELID